MSFYLLSRAFTGIWLNFKLLRVCIFYRMKDYLHLLGYFRFPAWLHESIVFLFVRIFKNWNTYNCFIVFCQFLPYNEVYQLYAYIYPLLLGSPSHPVIPPIQVITEHQAELLELCNRFPPSILHISISVSRFTLPFLPPHRMSTCLFICINI